MNQLKLYTRTLTLRGLVQGVGYRPFVRREALSRGITGDVRNIGGGVTVHAFGTKEALDGLTECLLSSPPKGTVYLETEIGKSSEVLPAECPDTFTIAASREGGLLPIISPDIAPCRECARELRDPDSRRYRYPFQSCALCGPRYSIQLALPYDRVGTTMRDFMLCKSCAREYNTPADRRSYAQTIACKDCGPRLTFYPADPAAPSVEGDEAAVRAALDQLQNGGIVAVKNNGGFHLACLASDVGAIRALRAVKGREAKPFAVLFPELAAVQEVAEVNAVEAELLTSPARPIVLLKPKGTLFPPEVSGESLQIGVMLPSTPLQMLLSEAGVLVMTSANRSGEPIFTEFAPLKEWLFGRAAILTHDRPIVTPQDDSLLFVEKGEPCFLRRARGYAPLPIRMDGETNAPLLAMGGDLKSVFALCRDEYVYLSQPMGDLADEFVRRGWSDLQSHLSHLLGIVPKRAICDLHPGYFSREAAERSGLPTVSVQHHHAHIASVMAEHRLHRVLGFAFDGTGYGEDGTVWGGELLLCEGGAYRRVVHLLPLPMPGGDEGARDALRLSRFFLAGAGATPETPEEVLVTAAVKAGMGIKTSSMGRLFDAASAILGICCENTYEGRAAILLENAATLWLENAATLWEGNPAPLSLPLEGEVWRTDLLLLALREGVRKGTPVGALALGFHHAIAAAAQEAAVAASEKFCCTAIALSGGVFANRLLLRLCGERLEDAGFSIYRNQTVPVGDGGIALGQAFIAAHRQ